VLKISLMTGVLVAPSAGSDPIDKHHLDRRYCQLQVTDKNKIPAFSKLPW
jgi:hypothetical protein